MTTKVCSVCNDFIEPQDGVNRCCEHTDTQRVSQQVREKRDLRNKVLTSLGMTRVVMQSGGVYYSN